MQLVVLGKCSHEIIIIMTFADNLRSFPIPRSLSPSHSWNLFEFVYELLPHPPYKKKNTASFAPRRALLLLSSSLGIFFALYALALPELPILFFHILFCFHRLFLPSPQNETERNEMKLNKSKNKSEKEKEHKAKCKSEKRKAQRLGLGLSRRRAFCCCCCCFFVVVVVVCLAVVSPFTYVCLYV